MSAPVAIQLGGLAKSYGPVRVLQAVELDVVAGQVTAILGASGSGKTTLLRLIAGFDTADAGTISVNGRVVDDGRRTVSARRRGIGYVPQDAALFPHLTVAANVGFGVPRRHRGARVAEMLELVGLPGYQRRYPHQLSGGQQQRVALARALAIRPSVVLLDEPFGALDAALRESVRTEVLAILARTATTTVLVTHDQDEALSAAHFVALLEAGRVAAYGTPIDLYRHPPNPAVAAAIGTANLLPARRVDRDGARVDCALGTLALGTVAVGTVGVGTVGVGTVGVGTVAVAEPVPDRSPDDGQPAQYTILVRPEDLRITLAPTDQAIPATVVAVRYHGHDTLIDLATATTSAAGGDAVRLTARVAGPTGLRVGQPGWVSVIGPVHAWPTEPRAAPADPDR